MSAVRSTIARKAASLQILIMHDGDRESTLVVSDDLERPALDLLRE